MTAWPWLHEDLFLQQNWIGLQDFRLDSFEGPAPSQTDVIATFVEEGQGASNSNLDQYTRHNKAVPAILTPGEACRANIEASQHALNTQSSNQADSSTLFSRYNSQLPSSMALFADRDLESAKLCENAAVTSTQMTVLSELIAYARQASLEPPSRGGHATYWYSMSMRLRESFNLFSELGPNASAILCLDYLVHLYWENFWALWPMISVYFIDASIIEPVLYLAISSIGAMYGRSKASHFGVLLHKVL